MKPIPTNEYIESRQLDGVVISKARERIVAQHKLIKQQVYNPYLNQNVEKLVFDYPHFDRLISSEYTRLRGLYSVPFIYQDFENYVYEHPTIRYLAYTYFSERHNRRVLSRRRKHHQWDKWGSSTGLYYRKGPNKGNGGAKKQESYSDQYHVDSKQAKQDWRDKKGFKRDKAKRHGCFCKCRLTDSKYRRRFERDLIKTGQYDKIHTHKDQFLSNWDCC